MTIEKIECRAICSAIAVLILIATSTSSLAQQFEPTWQLEFDVAFVDPSSDNVLVNVDGARVNVDFDSQAGVGVRAEYQFAESLAVEFGILATAGFDITVGGLGDTFGVATRISSFAPITAGLNYHFTPGNPVDFYAGPFFAIVRYGDIETEAGTGGVTVRESVDTDFGWGAIVGLDVPIRSGHWSLGANLRYIDTNMKGTSDGDPFDGDFDPFILSFSVGYRF